MGRNKSASDTLLRQWHMLRGIPRYPKKVAVTDLKQQLDASGYGVTARTIQRDLVELSELFPLVSDERERPFGWSWQKDALAFDLPNLSSQEALAFAMVERFLRPLLPETLISQLGPYFKRAKVRLDAEAPTRGNRSWLGKIAVVQPTQNLRPPKVNAIVHGVVTNALLQDRRIAVRYRRKGTPELHDYVLSPLGLIQRGPMTYVVAAPGDSDEPRTFALNRIQRASMLDQSVRRPKGFSLEGKIAVGMLDFGAGATIRLEAIFKTSSAEHLTETPLSEDQVVTAFDDDHVRLAATVLDTPQLKWWLLGFGSQVRVIGPVELRREFATITAAMAADYVSENRRTG